MDAAGRHHEIRRTSHTASQCVIIIAHVTFFQKNKCCIPLRRSCIRILFVPAQIKPSRYPRGAELLCIMGMFHLDCTGTQDAFFTVQLLMIKAMDFTEILSLYKAVKLSFSFKDNFGGASSKSMLALSVRSGPPFRAFFFSREIRDGNIEAKVSSNI